VVEKAGAIFLAQIGSVEMADDRKQFFTENLGTE
jgi:hypothetical protein